MNSFYVVLLQDSSSGTLEKHAAIIIIISCVSGNFAGLPACLPACLLATRGTHKESHVPLAG
ncbi:GH23861 [Drosophila grimshawi]|uniref:GH23861 n=1 Tax=Drosophila grimshawi TaxID=7222 RepID=B4K449_DROGR|nr:GH23861 [Drosophila grimshawi]